MTHLSILVFIISLCRIGRCEYLFTMNNFTSYDGQRFNTEMVIGGVPYNVLNIDLHTFCWDNCMPQLSSRYPVNYDYPKIYIPNLKEALILHEMESLSGIEIQKYVNSIVVKKNVTLRTAIGWVAVQYKSDIVNCIITWNSNETYLILGLNNRINAPNNFISLGRGSDPYSLDKYTAKAGRNLFIISSETMVRPGCTADTFSFTIDPINLSNLGGEKVIIEGPCPIDITNKNAEIRFRNIQQSSIVAKTSVISENKEMYFIMPFVFNSGEYEIQLEYNRKIYDSKAYVYPTTNYGLQWTKTYAENSMELDSTIITLTTDEPLNKAPAFVTFYIVTVDIADKTNSIMPLVKTTQITLRINDAKLQFSASSLLGKKFNIDSDIGFFSLSLSSSRIIWSAPFSLIWLVDQKNSLNEEKCVSLLKPDRKQATSLCPDHVSKVKSSLSIFQGDYYKMNGTESLSPELLDQDCYIQTLTKRKNVPKNGLNGVTCCYDKTTGYLIYGQDFYNRHSSIVASYGWDYSPISQPYQHFFFDRFPIIACCALNNNQKLCSKYWETFNKVESMDFGSDHAGNVIGDPHMITFNSQSKYSFLSIGEYWIMISRSFDFVLQGRFYSNGKARSTLKSIAFSTNNKIFEISPKMNFVMKSHWGVFINKTYTSLPIYDEGLTIIESKDNKKLFVYIESVNNSFIHLELSRFHFQHLYNEYMNMKIFLSNGFRGAVDGGLLGRSEYNISESSLYEWNSTNPVGPVTSNETLFAFAKTWQLQVAADSFFSTQQTEFESLNVNQIYEALPTTKYPHCNGLSFCNIDREYYDQEFSIETLKAHSIRMEFENNIQFSKQFQSCGHPKWPYFKLNSGVYTNGSVLQVTGCMGEDKTISNQKLVCDSQTLKWIAIPPIIEDICKSGGQVLPVVTKKNNKLGIYIGVPLAIILLLVLIAVSVIIFKRRQKDKNAAMTSEFSNTSQDPLNAATSIPLGDVYDVWNSAKNEEEDYGVYTKIQKPTVNPAIE